LELISKERELESPSQTAEPVHIRISDNDGAAFHDEPLFFPVVCSAYAAFFLISDSALL
jgi:hypothetical protein